MASNAGERGFYDQNCIYILQRIFTEELAFAFYSSLKMTRYYRKGENPSGVFVGAEAVPEVLGVVDVRSPDLPQTVAPHARSAEKVRR